MDVYIDLGRLILVKAEEIIDLEGSFSCHPLVIVHPTSSKPTKKPVKKVAAKPKPTSVSGTI